MRDKGRVRGTFRTYLQWPLMMSVFMILLTALVAAVSLKAGIIVSVLSLIHI